MITKPKKFPLHGWIGLVLVSVFWFLNWYLDGLRTQILFFPLWLGYALTVDALVFYRKGSSLLTRNFKRYTALFLISAPAWWLFELFNLRTLNWIYVGKEFFSEFEYGVYSTLSFSTVIPSVFGTAELISSFKWIKYFTNRKKIIPAKKFLLIHFLSGLLMLSLIVIFPEDFFVFVWFSVFFILEPVNVWMGNNSVYNSLSKGNWTEIISLLTGCIICGFFWEMWNYLSYPKWIYDIHFANVLHIFEMPLPGYLGYFPFGLELISLYNIIVGITGLKQDNYIRLTTDS